MIGQRNMLCGLHVHVELPDPDDRVDVMTRMLPYLPLFIALATSSPFWRSRPTGLKGYRLAAYDELPRTGVPELFRTKEEFDAYVDALVKAGVMEDSSYMWWSMRPSLKHPTLELRAPDCPTLVDDSIAIAALYRSLARRLTRNPELNRDITAVTRAIVVENKWRAQRYGVHGTFVGDARRHHGRRHGRAGDGGDRGRRRGARLPRRDAALPHHRRLPAPRPTPRWRCTRSARQGRRPRPGADAPSPTGSRRRRCSNADASHNREPSFSVHRSARHTRHKTCLRKRLNARSNIWVTDWQGHVDMPS